MINYEDIVKKAMSRGKVVIDENLEQLIPEMQNRNIVVITPHKGMQDEDIKSKILPGRLFITNNSIDFVKDATSYEYGIISTENIKFKDPKVLSKLISDAIIEFKLWSLVNSNRCFILYLKTNKKHVFKFLED